MGYVGVTKGGGEEVGREEAENLDRRLCVIQTQIDMSHTPAQGTIVSLFQDTPLARI